MVLASGSAARRDMLRAAGLSIDVVGPDVDESAIKLACRRMGMTVAEAAIELALAKARAVSPRRAGRLILAADQLLECEGAWFDKPTDRAAAAEQLSRLSGKTHRLVSAAILLRDDARLWHSVAMAELTMRRLSDGFIDDYLDRVGNAVLSTVGGYQIEGLGIQLFEDVSGDHFTILGLPLLPLLRFLREARIMAS